MNDLRSRIAAIVERDRARHQSGEAGARGGAGTETLSTRETPSLRDGDPSRAGALGASASTSAPFSVFEKRIAVDDLGLEIVGRGACDARLLAHLGLKGESPARWQDVLWLDTETTGLAGGTGTYVFLLGIAYFSAGELVLRQHLLHDIGHERAFVEAIQNEIERFRACASYNGKSFDLPLLRTRWVMTLRSEITVDESHLDLLHPARRLWRDRYGSTGLKQLEESLFDEGRINDIPGSLIPDAYFHYLRKRDPKIIAPVLEHNARDVVSLVRIADRVATAVLAARSGHAPDHAPAAYALARSFERTGELDAAFACYESAYYDGDNPLRVKLALSFARELERRAEIARALRMVETLLELGLGSERWREQAASRVRRLTKKRWRQLATAS
jgi:uncharacterized protein YprB with RNaseH-like and TPR domain